MGRGTTAIPAGCHGRSAELPKAPWSADARRVLEARYLRRDAGGRVIETPDELVRRVARAVAHAELLLGTAREAEHWEARFSELLAGRDFLPNSPALMNAGTPLGQLAACFVLPVADSMEGIFGALRAKAPQVLTLGAEEAPSAREFFTKCDPGACRL